MFAVSFLLPRVCALLVTVMLAGSACAAPVNLLTDVKDWTVVTPYPPEGMTFTPVAEGPRLKISAHAGTHHIGGWARDLPALAQGRRYRFEAIFSAEDIPHPQRHVWAILSRNGREYEELVTVDHRDGLYRLCLEFTPVKEATDVQLRFYLSDIARGEVTWRSASMEDVTESYTPRTAHIAAISGRAPKPATQKEAIDFYISRLDEVGKIGGIDLVCLPENINTDALAGDKWKLLESIPGQTTRRLAEKARQYRMYIVASLAELDGGVRYNTAVLIDREGRIAAKYRKTHLTISEHLINGISEGTDFVVAETDFGKVGLVVCYDYHFPETLRILALKGAELVVMPNAADGRNYGALWESVMRTRAVDNHLFIAAGVNWGRSMIVAPNGEILAQNQRSEQEPGGIVHAVCEFGVSVYNHTGQSIEKRYLRLRRPELYAPLLRDIDGDLKVKLPAADDVRR